MFPDGIRQVSEILLGGPDVPFAERLLRGGLVGCSLFVGIQWFSLWGTRWGDRHRVAKSFVLSLLVHLCLCLGWATVVASYGLATVSSAATPSAPIPVTLVDSGPARMTENRDAGTSFWQRPLDQPAAPQTRTDLNQESDSTELPRMTDLPQPLRELDVDQPSVASNQELPETPQQMKPPEAQPAPAPVEAPPTQNESPVAARQEMKPTVPFQRSAVPQNAAPSETAEQGGIPRAAAAREELSALKNAAPIMTPGNAGESNLSEKPAEAHPAERLPQPRRVKIPVVRAAPAPVNEPKNVASTIGILRGVVKDAETGRILAGTTIRFDRPQGKPLVAVTDAEGRYELSLPETPDNFAVTASHGDYLPEAKNMKSVDIRGKTRRLDFALRQPSESVIPLEDEPEVHHLGNDRFQGSANSQFQQKSEGTGREFQFTVTAEQIRRRFPAAVVTFLAKGVQCAPRVWVNGHLLDSASKLSPADGAYGTLELPFDSRWLRTGDNTLTMNATDCNGDLDDFEFVNVQIRLTAPTAKPGKE